MTTSDPKQPGLLIQLKTIFDREDGLQATGLLVLMIIGAALEMLAVSMMFPLIEALSNPTVTPRMPVAVLIHRWTRPADPTQFALWLLGCLVCFYVIKNLFFTLLFYLQNRFGFHAQNKLSYRLFDHYLRLPYTFHLQRNTADLHRNLTHETDQVVWALMIPGLTLITESLIALALAALLFYSSFQAAVVITSVFGITGIFYYRFFRSSLERWGNARIHHDILRVRAIQEGLGSIKELKVLGRGSYFLNTYARHNALRGAYSSKHNMVLNTNLLLLEVLGMSSLLILVGLHLAQGKPFETILPLMGVFAGAAFRLIPATNRIINSVQQIQYAFPILRNLHTELIAVENQTEMPTNAKAESASFGFNHEIRLEHLTFRYAPDKPAVLDGVDLTVPRGSTIGIIGPSGAGKTTLIDILLGIIKPDAGRILVDGRSIDGCQEEWQSIIGYVPQTTYLTDGTIRQNVAFAIRDDQIDDAHVELALRDAQLWDYVVGLPDGINTPVGELGKRLSGGQRQRIGIARALYHSPQVLVLDEATSSLDNATESDVLDAVRQMHREKTIMIITHRLTTLGSCDHVYRLVDTRLIETNG